MKNIIFTLAWLLFIKSANLNLKFQIQFCDESI